MEGLDVMKQLMERRKEELAEEAAAAEAKLKADREVGFRILRCDTKRWDGGHATEIKHGMAMHIYTSRNGRANYRSVNETKHEELLSTKSCGRWDGASGQEKEGMGSAPLHHECTFSSRKGWENGCPSVVAVGSGGDGGSSFSA